LVLYFHAPIHYAVAASLITIIATSSAVAAVNVERGLANMRLGLALEISTAAGALCGAYIAGFISAHALQMLFSAILFVSAIMMLKKGLAAFKTGAKHETLEADAEHGTLGAAYIDQAGGNTVRYRVKRFPFAAGISVVAGAVSGLLGIGGGIIQVPLMNTVCGVPMKAAAATSNFMMGVTAAASAAVFLRRGIIMPQMTALLVIGVLAGSVFVMKVLAKAKSEKLQIAFSILILAIAFKMLAAVI